MTAMPLQHEVEYPESDGQPMGETEFHGDEMFDLIAALKDRYRDQADVHVGGNLFLYYVQGDPRAVVCPDVFLTRGMSKELRRTYKLWQEGRAPEMVIEVTSRHTRREDTLQKKEVYARLGVREYFLHDPFGEYLSPRLQGFRLDAGRYQPIEPAADGSLSSEVTGLALRLDGRKLRLVDAATGEPLLRIDEVQAKARREEEARLREEAARRRAEAAVAREAAARHAAEEELARLRRELERRQPG